VTMVLIWCILFHEVNFLLKSAIKALTTGGLPTFIDVGNNFGAPARVEDNIMYQILLSTY
jgi:hypothetical protein